VVEAYYSLNMFDYLSCKMGEIFTEQ